MEVRAGMNKHVAGLTAVLLSVALAGCGGAGTYKLLGNDAFEVRAEKEVLSRAVRDASQALAESVTTRPATVSYPSLGTTARSWQVEKVTELTWARTSFRDTSGRQVCIEEIQRRGQPVLVFIEYEGGDPLAVINAIVGLLAKAGVRPVS